MNFERTEDQTMLVDSARRMVADDIQPILDASDPDKPLSKADMLRIFGIFAREGLTAPRLPVEAGGSGMAMLDYGMVYEQLPPVVAISLLSHEVSTARIFAESTPEQREALIPDLIAGKRICCTGSTEPDTGSDPRGIKTRVEEKGGKLVINGRKMWITNGSISDVALVTCIGTESSRSRGAMRRIAIDRAQSPYEAREIPTIGLRQGHLSELLFDNCTVPVSNALGESGDAARVLTVTWNINRPLMGLSAVHLAQRALDAAIEYAGMRKQFGRVIGGTQLVQERLADIATTIETSRLICYRALAEVDMGRRSNGLSAMAKRYATNACLEAISLAMGTHGAMGISRELKLEQLYRDARMLLVPDGTNEILTLMIGRELTGIDAFRAPKAD
ncbi:MAG: acyl-CoA dehydrogenase family protein [Pseudorhodoplanes sp.]